MSLNGRVWGRVYSMCSRLSLHVSIWMCVFQVFFSFAGEGSTVVHIRALRQCGALWFPATPNSWFSSFFLSFILLHSLSYSLPLPSSPYIAPFVYSIEDVWLNILRPAESIWFSNLSCPLCQWETKACAKYIWMRSLNLPELFFHPSFFPFLPFFPFSLGFGCSHQHYFLGPYLRICKHFFILSVSVIL